MSEVKPPTDEEIATMPDRFAAPAEWGGGVTVDEAFSLLARIESDRADIARLKAEVEDEKARCRMLKAEVERLKDAAFVVSNTLNNIRRGFHAGVDPSRWVDEVQALLGTGRAR